MLQFTAKMSIPEVDAKAYQEALIAHLLGKMKLAGAEFAKAALARIPVRTGFVAGAFGTLTDLVGTGARFNPIVAFVHNIIAKAKGIFSTPTKASFVEYYYGGGEKTLKTPTSGRRFASDIDRILVREGSLLTFNYSVDITYFSLQDVSTGRSPTAPWQAFVAGEAAFIAYMEENALVGAPQVSDFIKYRKVNIR